MTTATKERGSTQQARRAKDSAADERSAEPQGAPVQPPPDVAKTSTRVAVVLVHGMGEQRPMDTLRSLATSFVAGTTRRLWSVPDRYDCTFELHGFVVEGDPEQPQLDLYEGYWAAGMQGTKLAHVGRFARQVLLRSPSRLPERVRKLWWMLLVSGLVALGAAGWIAFTLDDHDWRLQVAKGVGGLVLPVVTAWLCTSIGDVARFVDSHPDNIEVRLATRKAIVGLLDKLHEDDRYERIVVIGHSLGGLVAYDAVRLLWAKRTRDWNAAGVNDTVAAKEAATLKTVDDAAGRKFDVERGKLFTQMRAAHSQWLISDLVTVGSPVAYPELFLATPAHPLDALIREREVPTCPPQPADPPERSEQGTLTYQYPSKRSEGFRVFHHAALFCVTRWTNVYAAGDFVGGPVPPALGRAVQNISLEPSGRSARTDRHPVEVKDRTPMVVTVDMRTVSAGRWSRLPVLSHTRYWSTEEGITLLRAIVCREQASGKVPPKA